MRALNDFNEHTHCKHRLKCSKASSLVVTEHGLILKGPIPLLTVVGLVQQGTAQLRPHQSVCVSQW